MLTDQPVAQRPADGSIEHMFPTTQEAITKLLQLSDAELKSLLRTLRKQGKLAQA